MGKYLIFLNVILVTACVTYFSSCSSSPSSGGSNHSGGGQNIITSFAGVKGLIKVMGVSALSNFSLSSSPLGSSRLSSRYGSIKNSGLIQPNATNNTPSYDFSGPADYIKMTLLQINFQGISGNSYVGWTGSELLTVSGDGYANTGGIALNVPTNDIITNMQLVFSTSGAIKGTLTGPFDAFSGYAESNINGTDAGDTDTFYTSGYYTSIDVSPSNTTTGGAPDFTYFTSGPSTEESMLFDGPSHDPEGNVMLNFPVATNQGSQSNLTIIMDIDRCLRFNDGIPGPGLSITNHAGFYTLPVNSFIMASFGTPGLIQGYQTEYQGTLANTFNGESGWLELIFDSYNHLLCGSSMADQDANYCVCAGEVTNLNTSASTLTYCMGNSIWTVRNFTVQSTIGSTFQSTWTNLSGMQLESGLAAFTLDFQAQ